MEKIIVILIYAIAMIGIGVWSSKHTKDMAAFLLGGRKAGALVSAFAYGTTYFSAVLFIGYAGTNGWTFGAWAVLIGVGNALIGTYLAWKVLASPTRRMTHQLKVATMPEFFHKRYNSKGMKSVAAIIIFIFMTPYSASVYSGLSYLFEQVFNIDYLYAILMMAAISAIYLTLGGYIATLIADFVQGIIMLVGVSLMLGVMMDNEIIGGIVEGTSKVLDFTSQQVNILGNGNDGYLSLISLILLTSFGTWGLPQIIHKFYAIADEKAIKSGTIISTLFATLISCGAYFTGAVAKYFFSVQDGLTPLTETGAVAFDRIIPNFLTLTLPDLLLGIIVVLVLSASVTTLTGIVLVSSSSFVMDIVKPLKPNITPRNQLILTRVMCFVFIGISVLVALTKSPIQTLMAFSWGTVSGSFLAPFAVGLYWKNVTQKGAWAGILGGFLTSATLAIVFKFNTAMSPVFGVVAMIVSFILTITVSLVTKKFNEEHIEFVFGNDADKAS